MGNLLEIQIEDFLLRCVEIEPLQLEEELVSLPSQMAYWNQRLSEANKLYLRAKIERDQTYARVRLEMKARSDPSLEEQLKDSVAAAKDTKGEKDAKVKPKKPPTVDDIKAMTDQDPAVQASAEAELMAEAEYDRLRGVMDVLRTKREMLVALAANMRQEFSVNPNMRDEMAAKRYREGGNG